MNCPPSFDEEIKLHEQGYKFVAGVDEVGRGALAGPVVAAAVIFPISAKFPWLSQVRDSKEVSPAKRQSISSLAQQSGIAIGLGMISHTIIDNLGIIKATQLAMSQAINKLPVDADYIIIDAVELPEISLPQKSIMHGDKLSISIACASIIAKVNRDEYMMQQDILYPGYGLAGHKGYGTSEHLLNLNELGPCPIHRRSFSPVGRLFRR